MNSREFPKKFSTSGLLGSYLRVIQNGSIESGDELKLIKTEEDSLSLFDISSILFKRHKQYRKDEGCSRSEIFN